MRQIIAKDNICAVNEEILAQARSAACGGTLSPVLIIVPDRFTLQAEKILMRDTKALLNVRVLTFSMLYNLVHEELAGFEQVLENRVLDKTSAVLFMWRAIQSVCGDLVYFGKSVDQYAFAEKMFNTVNQLKSCNADFDNLEKNSKTESVTRRKMHDIMKIQHKYAELTKEYTDSAGALGWLIENAGKSKTIKQAHVFITGFEHLSVQRAEVVRVLARVAKTFTAGTRKDSEIEGLYNEVSFAM